MSPYPKRFNARMKKEATQTEDKPTSALPLEKWCIEKIKMIVKGKRALGIFFCGDVLKCVSQYKESLIHTHPVTFV